MNDDIHITDNHESKTHSGPVPAVLAYEGQVIHNRGEMLSLTDMWKAAGSDPSKEPKFWRRQDGVQAFIDAVALAENVIPDHLFVVRKGRNGGTWAHWQVSLAYAKYLSSAFHMWCNTVVRDRMTGQHVGPAEVDYGKIGRQMAAITEGKLNAALALIPTMINAAVDAAIAMDPRRAVLNYVSVRQMLDDAKAVSKGRNSLNRKFGYDLRRRSLLLTSDGKTASPVRRCPHSGVWLYQRDFADLFMAERGLGLVRDHNSATLGQSVIRFPDRRLKKKVDQELVDEARKTFGEQAANELADSLL